jgi:hypothetical protein
MTMPLQLLTYNLFDKHSRCLCNYIYCIKPSLKHAVFCVLKPRGFVASDRHTGGVPRLNCKYVKLNTVSNLSNIVVVPWNILAVGFQECNFSLSDSKQYTVIPSLRFKLIAWISTMNCLCSVTKRLQWKYVLSLPVDGDIVMVLCEQYQCHTIIRLAKLLFSLILKVENLDFASV